ncbi:MAG TPA: ATP-binding protein [Edaphobacter sp.]|nr:ATP-binding protein [Edaphobacter sp.]
MQSAEVDVKGDVALTLEEWKSMALTSGGASGARTTSQLKAGYDLRTALVNSIAHDLRSPLTAIYAAVTTLMAQSKLTKGERKELIAVIEEESVRLDRLIGQTLKIAQLHPDAVRIIPHPENIREVISIVLEEACSQLGQHSVRIQVSDSLPPVPMDRELVGRVLRHLLVNAAQYSPAGSSIMISGGIEDHRLVVTVADQGPGIDAAEEPFIFDECFRGRNQRLKTKGTGMGLPIAKAILDAHRAESKLFPLLILEPHLRSGFRRDRDTLMDTNRMMSNLNSAASVSRQSCNKA